MKKNMRAVLCACLMLGVLAGCSGGTEAVSEAGEQRLFLNSGNGG